MSLGIILVFDLSKPETFQNLKERMNEITENAGFIPIILMGTNLDAENEFGVQIPSMDIDQFMYKYGIDHYIRVSTKTGEGIQQAFEIMSDEIIRETIRKLGPDEVKRRIAFSFALAMIGDKSIRKDWISEFGVQRFAAPPTMSGAISRKTLDRDIHHLIPEPLMDKAPPISPPSSQQSPLPGAAPVEIGGAEDVGKKVREELFEKLSKAKAKEEKIEKEELDDLEGIGRISKPVSKLEEKSPVKEEIELEKPKPLQPMDFRKLEEEKVELSEELKANIEEELNQLRGIIRDETTKKIDDMKRMKSITTSAPSPPPTGPPSAAAPAPVPAAARAAVPPPPPKEEAPSPPPPKPFALERAESFKEEVKAKKKAKTGRAERKSMEMAREPKPFTTAEMAAKAVKDEFVEGESMYEEEVGVPEEMEITTEKLLRKTTVFYRERMNPETLNKLAVVLSSEKIYEKLKIKIEEVARAATDKILEIDKEVPIVDVVPEFPGCVCVPSVQHLNAKKEYDIASFLITPLQAGDIPDANVKLYHKGLLIETIPTPTKVVKTTSAKISAGIAIIVPLLSQFPLISGPIDSFLGSLLPFYSVIGGLEGIILILTALFAGLSGLLFLFKRPKDAKPIETFPEIDETLREKH